MNPTSSTRFRVALVAACDFPSNRGSQALIAGLADVLAKRGHEIHVVAYAGDRVGRLPSGVHVHYARRSRASELRSGPSVRRLVDDVLLTRTLYRIVRTHRIEIMHAHNYEGAIAACLVRVVTRTPVVYHAHNVMRDELELYSASPRWRSVARVAGAALDRSVPRRATFTIALTNDVAEYLQQCNVAADRLRVVPPVIGRAGLSTVDEEDEGGLAGHFVVAYGGNLDPYQDLDVLARGFLEFARTADEAILLIVTHETAWRERLCPDLRALIAAARAKVVVAADVGAADRWLRTANVLVSPRSSWSGYPMKLLNYLAAGKPLVAAAGSAKGLANGENALIFADRDAAGLAAALTRLRADRELRARLGTGAKRRWRQISDSAPSVSAIESIYSALGTSSHTGTRSLPNDLPVRHFV